VRGHYLSAGVCRRFLCFCFFVAVGQRNEVPPRTGANGTKQETPTSNSHWLAQNRPTLNPHWLTQNHPTSTPLRLAQNPPTSNPPPNPNPKPAHAHDTSTRPCRVNTNTPRSPAIPPSVCPIINRFFGQPRRSGPSIPSRGRPPQAPIRTIEARRPRARAQSCQP
jgi:hypothetical protein